MNPTLTFIGALVAAVAGTLGVLGSAWIAGRRQPSTVQTRNEWLAEYEMRLNEYARRLREDTQSDYEHLRDLEEKLGACQRELRTARAALALEDDSDHGS